MRFAKIYLIACLSLSLPAPGLAHARDVDAGAMTCFAPPKTSLYTAENFSSFPCDLTEGAKPKLLIVGEVHSFVTLAPLAGTEAMVQKARLAQELWASVEAAAAERQLILAGEDTMVSRDGHPFSGNFYATEFKTEPQFFGVEDGFAKVITTLPLYLLMSQATMAMYKRASDSTQKAQLLESLRYKMVVLLDTFWKSAYLQALWKHVPRPFPADYEEQTAKLLDSYACDGDGINKATDLMKPLTFDELKSVYRVFKLSLTELPAFLVQTNLSYQVPLDKEKFNSVVQRVSTEEQSGIETVRELLDVSSPLRETMMAANIAKLYCAMRSTGLNVIVKVGESHVKPLVRALKERAEKSGLDVNLIREEYADQLALKLRSKIK